MSDTQPGVDARRALLEKYIRREVLQARKAGSSVAVRAKADAPAQRVDIPDRRASVVAIQSDGSKRPFFFLHGDWLSGASWCFSLARQLGSDQPLYALEPFNFDGLLIPPPFEAIAAEHLKSLRSVQPEGPYLLGGFCNGGLLAYEMAGQLHRQGQKVVLLVLMDPWWRVFPSQHRLASGVITRIGGLLRLGQDKQLNGYILLRHLNMYLTSSVYRKLEGYERFRWGDEEMALRCKQHKGDLRLPRFDALFPNVEVLRQDFPAIFDWTAMRSSATDPYPGKITFFWDSEEPWRRKGWSKVAETNEVEVHIFPGRQLPMRTTYLPMLAAQLKAQLSKAQANT